jgi:hypothetical protein
MALFYAFVFLGEGKRGRGELRQLRCNDGVG